MTNGIKLVTLLHYKTAQKSMRKKGSCFELSEERDADLLSVYSNMIEKHLRLYGRVNKAFLMKKVVNSTAKRYWVSAERASFVMLKMEKGERVMFLKENKAKMFDALFKEYMKYRKEHPDMSARAITEIVILLPAPCFGLEPRVAEAIINKRKKECNRKRISYFMGHSRHSQ